MDALEDIEADEYVRLKQIRREKILQHKRRRTRTVLALVLVGIPAIALAVWGATALYKTGKLPSLYNGTPPWERLQMLATRIPFLRPSPVHLSIEATPPPAVYGHAIQVRGRIKERDSGVTEVRVESKVRKGKWRRIGGATVSAKGRFVAQIYPKANGFVRARVPGRGTSNEAPVLVRSALTVATSGTAFWRRPFAVKGRVMPANAGTGVTAVVKRGRRWWQVAETTTNARGQYRLGWSPQTTSTAAYRVLVESTPEHAAVSSAPVRVRAWYMVGLTFDDGPLPPYTNEILDALRRYRVKATFFPLGQMVREHPNVMRRAVREGNLVGNHSYSHPVLTRLSDDGVREQLASTSALVVKASGVRPRWMRPPGGATDNRVNEAAAKLGMKVAMWDVTAVDWEGSPSYSAIVKRVADQVEPFDIVLMHDGGGDRSQTAKAIPAMIRRLMLKGYLPVTLDELYPGASAPKPVLPANR